MVCAQIIDDRYYISLEDGYFRENTPRKPIYDDPTNTLQSFEQVLAQDLYDSAKRYQKKQSFESDIHIWIIGENDWQKHSPIEFRAIAEDETDPTYKLIITGFVPVQKDYFLTGVDLFQSK